MHVMWSAVACGGASVPPHPSTGHMFRANQSAYVAGILSARRAKGGCSRCMVEAARSREWRLFRPRFWTRVDESAALGDEAALGIEMIMFFKNVALIGALVFWLGMRSELSEAREALANRREKKRA